MSLIYIPKRTGVAYDPDAQAYFTAGGITDVDIKTAFNNFFLGLKADGIYSKIIAMYTFWQGTSLTPRLNLKDPRDLDAAHRGVWVGSPTLSLAGLDCTLGGMNTKLNMLDTTLNDIHFSFDSITDVNITAYDIFAKPIAGGTNAQVFSRLSNLYLSDLYNDGGGTARALTANTNSVGFFTVSRLPAPSHTLFKDGTQVFQNLTTEGGLTDADICLGVRPSDLLTSTRTYTFASVGLGLTPTDVANLNTLKSNLNTALGR